MGYRGVDKLSEASGVFDQLLVEDDIENPGEQTDKFPWTIQEDRSWLDFCCKDKNWQTSTESVADGEE